MRKAEMHMEVVNRKRSMTLPDGSWHECEDKRCAEKQGLHGVSRKIKSANNFGESKLEEIPMNKKYWSRSCQSVQRFSGKNLIILGGCTYIIYYVVYMNHGGCSGSCFNGTQVDGGGRG